MDELLRAWFVQQGIDVTVQKKENSFILLGTEVMVDPGFVSGKAIVEIQFEKQSKVIFIGSLRLPRWFRRQGKGREVTNLMKSYALEHGYVLLLDACDDCDLFWAKLEFVMIHKDINGLKIMGFPGTRRELLPVWQTFSQTDLCKKDLLLNCDC